jgi:hypothetical protein
MDAVLARIPVELTPMHRWLRRQDWSLDATEVVGSVSG